MEYFLKKTGRKFTSPQAILNHIRSVYGMGKEACKKAYMDNFDLSKPPICPICHKNELKFYSFFKGFSRSCSNLCANKRIGNDRKKLFKENYDEFVKNNLDWYRNNINKTKIYDIFDNSYTGNRTLAACMALKIKNKGFRNNDFWFIERNCKFCGKQFKLNILYNNLDREICNEKTCRSRKNDNIINVKDIEMYSRVFLKIHNSNDLNHLIYDFYKQNLSKDFIQLLLKTFCKDKEMIKRYECSVYKNNKDLIIYYSKKLDLYFPFQKDHKNYLRLYLEENYGKESYYEYLKEFHRDECFRKCISCENYIFVKDLFKSYDNERKFCSQKCYNYALSNKELREKYLPNLNSEQSRIKQSITIKENIKNNKFTPCVTNSWCKSRINLYFKNKTVYCRSSWDATFQILNEDYEYEKIRIPYINENNKRRIYIVDFVDEKNKILYEIKPKEELNDKNIILKTNAAIEWCKFNKYEFKIIDESYFKKVLSIKNNIEKIKLQENSNLILKRMKQFIKEI